jgi:hypothetical protein
MKTSVREIEVFDCLVVLHNAYHWVDKEISGYMLQIGKLYAHFLPAG